ncbi:MAG TPA: D-arabinono-1,4-lactone oxidase [Jatrophihabitans sp.]|jgi:L-gulonolactone oxidase|uniref:D-arabinono-1,4-lactone oxidase n=1 Tax=Jatrophihabitans sp. TaxID=1932789 RepID=UPI002F002C8E
MARQGSGSWRNWAGTYSVTPARLQYPCSPDEVAAEVCRAAQDELSVKAVGAGYSFTDIAVTRGVMLDLSGMTGVLAADKQTGLVTVAAGTTLRELNEQLWKLGLSISCLGNLDAATIAGAIATGTHGTGRRYAGLCSQVRALQLVTADGQLLECSAEQHPELFAAARLSLGALGIITAVTLQCEPAFALHSVEAPADYDDLLEVLAKLELRDHFEFLWFPHTRRVLTKVQTRLPADAPLHPRGALRSWRDERFLGDVVYEGINRLTATWPRLTARVNRLTTRALPERSYTDRAYRIVPSQGSLLYRTMEYAIPRASLPHVLDELDDWVQRSGEDVVFPVEVRLTAADNIPLSPAFGRETCYVAVYQYHRRSYDQWFAAVEAIAREADGRPHWAKLHYRSAEDLAPAYPLFDEFLAVRDTYDPNRRFSNDYLRRVLGS